MPTNINEFKIYTEGIISNKAQSGNTITPSQFNIGAHRAQMACFEKDRLVFLKTGESSDFLDWFLKNVTLPVVPLTGYLSYPNDYQHTAGVRSYFNGKERPVELVTNSRWGEVQASDLMPATLMFPKYTEFENEYRFLPKNIGIVMLDYYRQPTKPFWAYTIVNNVAVYDAANSIDFDFADFAFNRVAIEYIDIIAQNLKDPQLSQYVAQERANDKTLI